MTETQSNALNDQGIKEEPNNLLEIGKKLLDEGPHKIEKTPRRVRGLFGGVWVFDTCEARFVWEHAYYPYFYIPYTAFPKGLLTKVSPSSENTQTPFYIGKLSAGSKTTSRILIFSPDINSPLAGLVKIEVPALDAWFSEDTPLLGPHPKDPYKRIECLPSSREIRIEIEGTVIAKSSNNVFLYETMLRPRYYLAKTGLLDWGFLRESKEGTETGCPYKGVANYYDVLVNGKEYKDVVWYYKYPEPESVAVQGRLCFYNEKVDVFIDGFREER